MLLAARSNQPALPCHGVGPHVEERVIGIEPLTAPITHLGILHSRVIPIPAPLYAPRWCAGRLEVTGHAVDSTRMWQVGMARLKPATMARIGLLASAAVVIVLSARTYNFGRVSVGKYGVRCGAK